MTPARHKYKVGQKAYLLPQHGRTTQPSGRCDILALLPYEGYPPLYRVQSLDERHQRVVAESDLQGVR